MKIFRAWAALLLLLCAINARATVTLPVEVFGNAPSVEKRTVTLSYAATTLWLQCHSLTYADKAAFLIDGNPDTDAWTPLNNTTATVLGTAAKFGGIGGAFPVVKMTLPVNVPAGKHVIRFKFNKLDPTNVSNSWRVLAFNFYDGSTKCVSSSQFRRQNPLTWRVRYKTPEELAEGKRLWESAALIDSPMVKNDIKATCQGCHTRDGSDVKYFGYSNEAIVRRALFHKLTWKQGWLIASYIRSLPILPVGRPWNPPFQPGIGLDAKPASEWAAGAGIDAVLPEDKDTLAFIRPEQYAASARLNVRETPIALMLPDWNHWLPTVHPKDAWGDAWTNTQIYPRYEALRARYADTANLTTYLQSVQAKADVNTWRLRIYEFLKDKSDKAADVVWTPSHAQAVYSTVLWALVKNWEMVQEFNLAERGADYFGAKAEPRTWFGQLPFSAGPFMLNIPDEVGIGGSALTNEYFSNAWYHTQLILNAGNGQAQGTSPVDWGYVWGKFNDMRKLTDYPEVGRQTLYWTAGLQEWDRATLGSPAGFDPQKLPLSSVWVHPAKVGMWAGYTATEKKELLSNILAAWLDKAQQFTPSQYYAVGLATADYVPPPNQPDGPFGARLWYGVQAFKASGVDVSRAQQWGATVLPKASWTPVLDPGGS